MMSFISLLNLLSVKLCRVPPLVFPAETQMKHPSHHQAPLSGSSDPLPVSCLQWQEADVLQKQLWVISTQHAPRHILTFEQRTQGESGLAFVEGRPLWGDLGEGGLSVRLLIGCCSLFDGPGNTWGRRTKGSGVCGQSQLRILLQTGDLLPTGSPLQLTFSTSSSSSPSSTSCRMLFTACFDSFN